MKKSYMYFLLTVYCCCVFAIGAVGLEEDDFSKKMETDGLRNGFFVLQDGALNQVRQIEYINGARDILAHLGISAVEKNFPNFTDGQILDSIKFYYDNHPGKVGTPVAEILLSGVESADHFNVISDKMETDEFLNGYYLTSEKMDPLAQAMYVQGLCDATAKLDMDVMRKYYGDMEHPDIWDAVVEFYRKDMSRRKEPIVNAILYGLGREASPEKTEEKKVLDYNDETYDGMRGYE